jgi:hypothetical protein
MSSQAARVDKPRSRQQRGMTLFEYVMAVGVGALIVVTLVPISVYALTSLASLANYAEMNTSSLMAVDQLTTDIRRALRVESFHTNKVVLEMPKGGSVHYDYKRNSGTLVRKQQGKDRVLLTGCKNLTFSIYQRTPVAGTYDQYPAATNSETKVVAINWESQRQLIGARWTRDQVYSAKVVMRCR